MTTVELVELTECRFRAMGTDVHVLVVDGSDADLHWAQDEVERMEGRWSRFRSDSDVARINARPGEWTEVDGSTMTLVARALEARHGTGGLFDPALGRAMAAAGYDRTFADVGATAGARAIGGPLRAPDQVEIDGAASVVRVRRGTALDLGGIAKGWAADLISTGLLERGAAGACVNIGGDLRVSGRSALSEGWIAEVHHPGRAAEVMQVAAGLATSTVTKRRWRGPAGDARHHLLDTRTGRPTAGPVSDVTVLAATAADAEILTKAVHVDLEEGIQLVTAHDAAAVITLTDGRVIDVGDVPRIGQLAGDHGP